MEGYIIINQEKLMPKIKTMEEYILETELEAFEILRLGETWEPRFSDRKFLGWLSDQYDPYFSKWNIIYNKKRSQISLRFTSLMQNTFLVLSQRPQYSSITHVQMIICCILEMMKKNTWMYDSIVENLDGTQKRRKSKLYRLYATFR